MATRPGTRLRGHLSANPLEPPALAQTLAGIHFPINAGPLQHCEVDISEPVPVRCLKNGLWLSREKGRPFAVLMTQGGQSKRCYLRAAP